MRVQRTGDRILHIPGEGGLRFLAGKPVGANWWDPNNVGLSCIAAYRAIATLGSPWPNAPANYAESLQDWTGTNPPLIEGNGAVPWAGATGWGYVAAAVQYFDTNLIPANDQSWSMFVQYANVTNNGWAAGVRAGGGRLFWLQPETGFNFVSYANGSTISVGPSLLAGSLGVAGDRGYRNGVVEGAAIAAWIGVSNRSIYIGAMNNVGVAADFISANIYAVAIYDAGPAAVQAEALAIATAMAAL